MDKNNDAKIIQAVFGFLEAVNGKKDNRAVSALIRGMIEEIMSTESSSVESGMPEETNPWFRLDHSLRSPMNGILGFTGILLDEISDPELKWKVEQIKVSAEKLMQLLEHSNIYRYRPPVSGATLQKEEAADKNTGGAQGKIPAQMESKNQVQRQNQSYKPGTTMPYEPETRKKAKSAGRKLLNVLIVEDNMVNSNLLMQHLKKHYHTFFSQSGKAAIEVARNEKIDAILMDINLGPGIDGIQAMNEIRKQLGNEKLPIIAVTGYASQEDRGKFLEQGFDEFIAKPFEREEILSVLEKLLGPSA